MASAGNTGHSTGRRRSLDAEVNLVPFIDLLSMCICFLLMTAVWMELGALQVKQATGTSAAASTPQSYEMDVKFAGPKKLEIAIKMANGKKSKSFTAEGATTEERILSLGKILSGLGTVLGLNPAADLKIQLGQIFSVARVTPKAGIQYGELVSVMDEIRDHGIVNLGVVPVRE